VSRTVFYSDFQSSLLKGRGAARSVARIERRRSGDERIVLRSGELKASQ
jgi:hypothetical protein